MLAGLFRGNSGQRHSQYIESVTDDAHTRSLLFGQSQHVFNLTASPPPSPLGSPAPRPSSFDDQTGLELEEKDVRILLAQDAHGSDERPTLLFDSRKPADSTRSPIPPGWRTAQSAADKHGDGPRSKSSTSSEAPGSWSRASRDLTPKDNPFLECMFGAPSSAKASSSTKMHIIPAKNKKLNASEKSLHRLPEDIEHRRRTPLARAQTSGQEPTTSSSELRSRDTLLITRLFHVTLDEKTKVVNATSPTANRHGQEKTAKLVERKVPAFAVGLIVQLPYPAHRPRSSQSRHASFSSYGQSFTSDPSSYGSDMQSSWTFLDALPASLSSSLAVSDDGDQKLDMIVENWDVIMRGISTFERAATNVICQQLQATILCVNQPRDKPPKEKSMQWSNHRVVSIQDTSAIGRSATLLSASIDLTRRIVYAVRIPRVVTGLGLTAGHWIDEARLLYRICGGKQRNFFLFNLLTAFLGNHMQWLERLAPEWYRKQFQATHRTPETVVLASRTIVVSEHKGLARRLVYILASFLPGRGGIDGFDRQICQNLRSASISPSTHALRPSRLRRASKSYSSQADTAHDPSTELFSTSASSRDSHASAFINRNPQKLHRRKDPHRFDIGGDGIRTMLESGAGTSSAIVPQAGATPSAHISVKDSYFPESPLVETGDSIATADLSKVLQTAAFSSHRRTSSVSSRWGSLVSGISDIWSNKQSTAGDRGSVTSMSQHASPATQHKRETSSALSISQRNPLQTMVDELEHGSVDVPQHSVSFGAHNVDKPQSRVPRMTMAPHLHVDDQDGVVDVELDLPGFVSASSFTPPHHQASKASVKPLASGPDRSDSIHSHRSVGSKVGRRFDGANVNVGGYLRRHHEDFVLHAVRPYNDLHEDVKRSMHAETTPQETLDKLVQDASATSWVVVCTTLIADTRSFTIHRLTLRRQYECRTPKSAESHGSNNPNYTANNLLSLRSEEIADEIVMEFDDTLTDAVEKLLNVSSNEPSRSMPVTRCHSRNVSTGNTTRATPASSRMLDPFSQADASSDDVKFDHRDLVVGALEDVVRSVNHGLNVGSESARPHRQVQQRNNPKQENALREGVRRWMIDVEQTSVW